jgi:hypothetical protein
MRKSYINQSIASHFIDIGARALRVTVQRVESFRNVQVEVSIVKTRDEREMRSIRSGASVSGRIVQTGLTSASIMVRPGENMRRQRPAGIVV